MDEVCDRCGMVEDHRIHENPDEVGGHIFENSLHEDFNQHLMRNIWDNSDPLKG